MTTPVTPRPTFIASPAPELTVPDAHRHEPAPVRRLAMHFAGAGGCIVGAVSVAIIAAWLPWPASAVAWALALVLAAGGAVFGHPLWLEMRHGLLGFEAARLHVWQRDQALTLDRKRVWLHVTRGKVAAPTTEPPRIITVKAWDRDGSGAVANHSGARESATGRMGAVVPPNAPSPIVARYSPSDTQRLERFALPAPPDLPSKAHWMRQYLKPSGTAPSWRTCKKNMSEAEWRASCAALVAIGELEDLGRGKGFRWVK